MTDDLEYTVEKEDLDSLKVELRKYHSRLMSHNRNMIVNDIHDMENRIMEDYVMSVSEFELNYAVYRVEYANSK